MIQPGDFIYVWNKKCIVCSVVNESEVEAIYLDYQNRAINEFFIKNEEGWNFKYSWPCWGYADQYSRLKEYVRMLRNEL